MANAGLPPGGAGRGTTAQAVVELAVFGAVFIFVVGSIFQQGYAAASYQQAQLQALRTALLTSYQNTQAGRAQYNASSFLLVEDRLSVGAARQGVTDRQPVIAMGGGMLTTKLFYPFDWGADLQPANPAESKVSVLSLRVNGQAFRLSQAEAVHLRIRRDPDGTVSTSYYSTLPADACEMDYAHPLRNAAAVERLQREWLDACAAGGACPPFAYQVIVPGNADFSGDNDYMYDSNRNGLFTDDLWLNASYKSCRNGGVACAPARGALWKWYRVAMNTAAGAIDAANASYPAWDIDGDLVEETLYSYNGRTVQCDGAHDYYIVDLGVLDSNAGDLDNSDSATFTNPDDAPGLKAESSIVTRLQDGTVLELRNGQSFIPGTNELYASTAKKNQLDIISRVYQLNRYMAFPGNFIARNPGVVEVSCGDESVLLPSGQGGCCMTKENVLRTCFDLSRRTLYIRSRIADQRGRQWATKTTDAGAP